MQEQAGEGPWISILTSYTLSTAAQDKWAVTPTSWRCKRQQQLQRTEQKWGSLFKQNICHCRSQKMKMQREARMMWIHEPDHQPQWTRSFLFSELSELSQMHRNARTVEEHFHHPRASQISSLNLVEIYHTVFMPTVENWTPRDFLLVRGKTVRLKTGTTSWRHKQIVFSKGLNSS